MDHSRSGGKALRRADRCGLSCSICGRECLLEFFRQHVSNDTDLDDLAGQARLADADGDGVADLEAIEATGNHATTNRCLPTISIIGSPGRTTEPGLTKTLPTTPRSSTEAWHRHRTRPTPSGVRRLRMRPTTWSQFARRGRAPLRPTTSVERTVGSGWSVRPNRS